MLYIISIIIGIYAGILSHDMDGALVGGIIGFLFAQIINLNNKVENLQNLLKSKPQITDDKTAKQTHNQSPPPEFIEMNEEPEKPQGSVDSFPDSYIQPRENEKETHKLSEAIAYSIEQSTDEILTQTISEIPKQEDISEPQEDISEPKVSSFESKEKMAPETPVRPKITKPSLLDIYLGKAKNLIINYFTSGNLIVRIGLLVLFAGVAFLLKYVAERTVVPVEYRYIAVSAGSLLMMALGWKLRKKRTGYALSLLGGGIGVLYLTLFAAMRLHALLSPQTVMIMLVLIVIFSSILAITTNSLALAVLGMTGGYAAPILTSTGSGSHVQLFSYYLFLNIGIFVIAWFRSWRVLNVLGFVATFGIGSIWGYKYYTPEYLWSVEPFLIVNFIMYTIIAVLFSLKQAPNLKGLNDGTLVFGTPLVGFSLQAGLMKDSEYGLAYSALVLGLFYILLAWVVKKINKPYLKSLTESFVALSIGFATLAIPLGFDGRVTSAMWVAEGSALVWVGIRQNRIMPRFSGYALAIIGSLAFFTETSSKQDVLPWLNADYIGVLIIFAATAFIGIFSRANIKNLMTFEQMFIPDLMVLYSVFWWIYGGIHEINRFYNEIQFSLIQVFLLITTICTLSAGNKLKYTLLKSTSILVASSMLLTFSILPDMNLQYPAIFNNRFIGMILAAIFHFYLSMFWQNRNIDYQVKSHHLGNMFLISSLLIWFYAFVTEFRFYFATDEFLYIEITMAITALLLLITGAKKKIVSYKVASVTTVFLMFLPIYLAPPASISQPALLNTAFSGVLIYSMTHLGMSWYWQKEAHQIDNSINKWNQTISDLFLFIGLVSLYFRGLYEIYVYIRPEFLISANLVFITVLTSGFILLAHKLKWKSLHNLKYFYLPALMIALLGIVLDISRNFHQGYGLPVWAATAIFNYWMLRIYDKSHFRYLNLYHLCSLCLFVFITVYEISELVEYTFGTNTIWHQSSYTLATAGISVMLYLLRKTSKWPFARHHQTYVGVALPVLIICALLMTLFINLSAPGNLTLMPYIPLLNAIDVASILTLFMALMTINNIHTPKIKEFTKPGLIICTGLGFLILNASMLRCFHFWFEIPYEWGNMWHSFMVQTGLSILWTVTALILMIISTRREWRTQWLTGLGLIITVVAKLFLVDMSASGTIERIVAFLSVGVLLSVIGYFSPIPPDTIRKKIKLNKREP